MKDTGPATVNLPLFNTSVVDLSGPPREPVAYFNRHDFSNGIRDLTKKQRNVYDTLMLNKNSIGMVFMKPAILQLRARCNRTTVWAALCKLEEAGLILEYGKCPRMMTSHKGQWYFRLKI